ncbi:ABC transporter ATP-binding protein [Lachnoclostridium sp. Marseille-P6806]|uniref:ABC transporter ATP-binding protein n=1 Tax=Lachnoclostridium sp. Marseille-P6806 TaxID=2364793 RepID=UPI0010317195|nr:ABC transporter ATP-binding protein [Lachnoclostridium sp. Marseille-P6806]
MNRLKTMLFLDEQGEKNLRSAIIACLLTSLSLMIPFSITILVFTEALTPLAGETISWQKMWLMFGIGLAAFVVIFFFSKNDYRKTYVSSYGNSESTRLQVAEKMRSLPMSFFNAKDLSELSSNIMADCTNIEQVMSNIVPQLIANVISSVIVCAILAVFDWRMALAVFIMLPVATLVLFLSRKAQNRLFGRHVEARLNAEKQSQEYLEGIKVIRACSLGGDKFRKLDEEFTEQRRVAIRVELVSGVFIALSTMLLRGGIGIVTFVGVTLLTKGSLDFLVFLMFLLISSRIYGPILTVLSMLPDLLYLRVATQRLHELMESKPMAGDTEVFMPGNTVSFENVSFSYHDDEVLKEVSFIAREGEVTALVGPSGSGKSTISQLAARFWDTTRGSVKVGGTEVKTLDPEYLMKKFAFVFQNVILFNDTVEANIRIGKPDASEEEVRAAAKTARCDEFIEKLPDGYQTMLGENGATLSGGERQRISIARAFLKDAPIVILDEATASLDPESEVYVQQAINRLVADKTVLMIAHRLRTVLHADHIVVLEKGRIVEEGTGEELLAGNGLFSRLYHIQQGGI